MQVDKLIDKIDSIIGPPEAETEVERERRKEVIEQARRAAQIRKSADHSA